MLKTARLLLRKPVPDDLDTIHRMIEADTVNRFLGGRQSREESFARFLRNEGCWSLFGYGPMVVETREDGGFVGQCGLFRGVRGLGEDFDPYPEAGWVLEEAHWGKGYASEAMTEIIRWAVEDIGLERIVAIIAPENASSQAIAAKLGFETIGMASYKGEEVMRYALTAV